jgi:hypothetical protein
LKLRSKKNITLSRHPFFKRIDMLLEITMIPKKKGNENSLPLRKMDELQKND